MTHYKQGDIIFIVYDQRAIPPGDSDDASVIEADDNLTKLRRSWKGFGYPVFRYTFDSNGRATDETFVEVMP